MSEIDLLPRDLDYGPMLACQNCGKQVFKEFKFCPGCGDKRTKVESQRKPNVLKDKNFLSLTTYFFLTVTMVAVLQVTDVFDDGEDYLILLLIFAVIDMMYAVYNGRQSFLFSTRTLKWKPLLQVLGILFAGAFVVHYLADFLNTTLYNEYIYEDDITWSNLGVNLLLISLYPAILEEISFRGFLFHNVEQLSGKKTAVIVTSLIFGITHLSFVSLIWLIPLGYTFAFMRSKYNTLWYGVIGHFFYNTVVTILDLIL